MSGLETLLVIIHHAEQLHMLTIPGPTSKEIKSEEELGTMRSGKWQREPRMQGVGLWLVFVFARRQTSGKPGFLVLSSSLRVWTALLCQQTVNVFFCELTRAVPFAVLCAVACPQRHACG